MQFLKVLFIQLLLALLIMAAPKISLMPKNFVRNNFQVRKRIDKPRGLAEGVVYAGAKMKHAGGQAKQAYANKMYKWFGPK